MIASHMITTTCDLPGYQIEACSCEVGAGRSARATRPHPISGMRFDTSKIGNGWTEFCADGTAMRVTPLLAP